MKLMTRREAMVQMGLVTGAIVISDCATNPATGERELILMSVEEEVALGKQTHPQIVNTYGIYENSQLQSYLRNLGQRLVQVSPRKNIDYTFTLLDHPVVNAFAVPGGYIYMTRGIMAYFNDAAQFTGVLAHEVTHVVARHSAQQYSRAQLAQLGLGLGSIFSEQVARFAEFLALGTQLLFLKFSRDAEREADRFGVQYMSEIGYDGIHWSYFFNVLERMQGDQGGLPEWQSTHPDPGSREDRVRDMAAKYQEERPGKDFIVNRNEYLQLIDGMVFGEDPRNGYVQNGVFYQPELGFRFPVPRGWGVANQAAEVRMAPENQNALLIFRAMEGGSPKNTAQQFVSANNISVQSSSEVTINGMNAYRVLGTAATEEQELAVESYFIEMGNNIYSFHGVAPPNRFGNYRGTFQNVANGFNRVTQESVRDVSPRRIDIRTANRAQTLQQALNSLGVPKDQLQQVALLNGMGLNERVLSGTRLKVLTG